MLGGLLLMLAVVPAFDLVLICLAQVTTVAMPLVGWRLWTSHHKGQGTHDRYRLHFRLADMFLITALVAAGVLLAKHVPETVCHAAYVGWGIGFGCAVLSGVVAAALCFRWWLRLIFLAGLPFAAAFVTPTDFLLFLWEPPSWLWYPALPTVAAIVASCLLLFRAAGDGFADPSVADTIGGRPRRIAARLSLAVILLAISVLPAVAYYQMATPTPIPVANVPTPNAYAELARIGGELAKGVVRSEYQHHLNAARDALRHDSCVPVEYALDLHLGPVQPLRALHRAWSAEGRAAESDHRYDAACDTYLDLIRAGVKTGKGGLIIDWVLSRSLFVRGGVHGFQRVRGRLSYAKSCEAIGELESMDAMLEPLEESLVRENIFQQHAWGWPARIRFLPATLNMEGGKRMDVYWYAALRLLACDRAVHCFVHQHGVLPERLDDLVPEVLPAVPTDPYTGRALIYRRQSDSFLLYSTGPDRTDDAGWSATATPPAAGEDLSLPLHESN